jgi:quercetin dioxygenase-like cupin family protein
MDPGDDCEARAWFERTPPGFRRRGVVVEPGGEVPYDASAWEDAIVLVERGEIELECVSGGRERFAEGALLCLACVQLRTLRNRGDEAVVLVAVARERLVDAGRTGPAPTSRTGISATTS